MVDTLLAPLLAPLTSLRGVAPVLAGRLARVAGGERVLDLLFHMPLSFIDRRHRPAIRDACPGEIATFAVEVASISAPTAPHRPWLVRVRDATGGMELVFFNRRRPPFAFAAGQHLLVSGRPERSGGRLRLTSPDHVLHAHQRAALPWVEPVWPLTKGLGAGELRAALRQALAAIPPDLPEWHDPALLRRENWPGFREALCRLHLPEEMPGPEPRARLAYDELLAHQIAMAWARTHRRGRPGRALVGDGALRAAALRRFGHPLTPSQRQALEEIDADLAAPRRMRRLLQGDVGSGKTLVALLAMLRAAEAGTQAALLAPTEVLARQHLQTLRRLCPVDVGMLTGNVAGAERRRVLAGLASGRLALVVGTHALFQEAVTYRDLGLAVIDEQHRFGVAQRLELGAKGAATDVLAMTATPIPRSLLLTQCGEMDVSRLTGKPAGRRPVRTSIHSLATLEAVEEAIGRALDGGERVFWVCPMVNENEEADLAAAEARARALIARFGAGAVTLAHGQQEAPVRNRALDAFARGERRLLVATTLVEVGVDVPAASVMVIEHAERFGLAQLHQLRGRVGRGAAQSFCLLLHEDGLSEAMRRRLTTLRETEDGFVIADEDFRLRGGGDLLGRRQSGLPDYRLADPARDGRLIEIARRDAEATLARAPDLGDARGRALRLLLGLFGRRAALLTLEAG